MEKGGKKLKGKVIKSLIQRNRVLATNSNPFIFATQCRRPLILQTINSVIQNSLKI